MSKFTDEEVAYLQGQRLGRLATVDAKGDLHVVPVGFRYNPAHDTIDIGGHNFAASKKYRDALRHGRVAFVVDDVLPPWTPRFAPEMLRITPSYIVSFGVNDDGVMPGQGRVRYHGRKVQ